ncbi:TetR/AcrR family transcriptional regulator [Parafrankia sp. BMG5.11]|uniref:TetR/AcrR family transcriptional regulator n=1 Tax=Parafrankia sp. BMG5.11 TaxID=222540 RepID=UPI001039D571|nr:TetR/AcrR family transcriptional regulator [Parafrankia sp. BMG5.11]TCJ40312.1 TetR/AcrR family transcriptional regulator [Parafrankia sp. BMG5.11]
MTDQGTVPRAGEFARMARRRRRQPVEAEREILQAAIEMIGSDEPGPMTVAALMSRTGLGRSAFYAYFRDVPDLLRRLLREIEGELSAASAGWFDGNGDPVEDCVRSARTIVGVHLRHGFVLRVIAQAAATDPELAAGYRRAAVEGFVTAVTERLGREQARGRVRPDHHPQSARALMAMTDAYLRETLGHHPRADPAEVIRTLTVVWSQALYGRAPAEPAEAATPGGRIRADVR